MLETVLEMINFLHYQIWTMIRRIKRRGDESSVMQHLNHNGTILTSLNEISEEMAHAFASNSSLTSYFLAIMECQGHELLSFFSDSKEHCNSPFSMGELRCSLESLHDRAVDPDGIHFQFLKHLPKSALSPLSVY